jgi:hypothetical protein
MAWFHAKVFSSLIKYPVSSAPLILSSALATSEMRPNSVPSSASQILTRSSQTEVLSMTVGWIARLKRSIARTQPCCVPSSNTKMQSPARKSGGYP